MCYCIGRTLVDLQKICFNIHCHSSIRESVQMHAQCFPQAERGPASDCIIVHDTCASFLELQYLFKHTPLRQNTSLYNGRKVFHKYRSRPQGKNKVELLHAALLLCKSQVGQALVLASHSQLNWRNTFKPAQQWPVSSELVKKKRWGDIAPKIRFKITGVQIIPVTFLPTCLPEHNVR